MPGTVWLGLWIKEWFTAPTLQKHMSLRQYHMCRKIQASLFPDHQDIMHEVWGQMVQSWPGKALCIGSLEMWWECVDFFPLDSLTRTSKCMGSVSQIPEKYLNKFLSITYPMYLSLFLCIMQTQLRSVDNYSSSERITQIKLAKLFKWLTSVVVSVGKWTLLWIAFGRKNWCILQGNL